MILCIFLFHSISQYLYAISEFICSYTIYTAEIFAKFTERFDCFRRLFSTFHAFPDFYLNLDYPLCVPIQKFKNILFCDFIHQDLIFRSKNSRNMRIRRLHKQPLACKLSRISFISKSRAYDSLLRILLNILANP